MYKNKKLFEILSLIKHEREQQGLTLEHIARRINIGPDWIRAVESGDTLASFEIVIAICDAAHIDLSEILKKSVGQTLPENQIELSRSIVAEQQNNNLSLHFQYNDHPATHVLENATLCQFDELLADLRSYSYDARLSKTDIVINTFFKATELWPNANPSDIWAFFLSRLFQDPYNHPVSEQHRDFAQSWKRTSGWVLEKIFVKQYGDFLLKHGIVMNDSFSKEEVRRYLKKMNLNFHDVEEKADILLIDKSSDDCFGIAHVKASIAERRQNDQSFSEALLSKNYFSPFMTMDCKSTPSENPYNKGEFGPVKDNGNDQRSNKRLDFEEQGFFSACYSYNSNTIPTPAGQKATARIYVMDFKSPDDEFSRAAIAARDRLYGG